MRDLKWAVFSSLPRSKVDFDRLAVALTIVLPGDDIKVKNQVAGQDLGPKGGIYNIEHEGKFLMFSTVTDALKVKGEVLFVDTIPRLRTIPTFVAVSRKFTKLAFCLSGRVPVSKYSAVKVLLSSLYIFLVIGLSMLFRPRGQTFCFSSHELPFPLFLLRNSAFPHKDQRIFTRKWLPKANTKKVKRSDFNTAFCVFFDQIIEAHPDNSEKKKHEHVDQVMYWSELSGALESLRGSLGMQLFVKVHPRSLEARNAYIESLGYTLISDEELESNIEQFSVGIYHGSASVNFAVLRERPQIIILQLECFFGTVLASRYQVFADQLGLRPYKYIKGQMIQGSSVPDQDLLLKYRKKYIQVDYDFAVLRKLLNGT